MLVALIFIYSFWKWKNNANKSKLDLTCNIKHSSKELVFSSLETVFSCSPTSLELTVKSMVALNLHFL